MPASPFVSSRMPKDGPKKTIDRSLKEGEQASKRPRKTVRANIPQPSQKESIAARTTMPRPPTYARDTTRPRDRSMERFEPIFFSQTGVRGFGFSQMGLRHTAPFRAAQPV